MEKIPLTLTKEDFWNKFTEQYPEIMADFKKWCDEYKVRVGFQNICFSWIKIHDLPTAMQLGLFAQFSMERFWSLNDPRDRHRKESFDDIVEAIQEGLQREAKFRKDPPRMVYVCGHSCEPNTPQCNNYCNMKTVDGEKFKGKMPDSPADIPYVKPAHL